MFSSFIFCISSLSVGCSPYDGHQTYEEASQRLEGITFSEKKAGVLQWELHSLEGTVLEERFTAELDKPRLTLYDKGAVASRAESDGGTIHTLTHEIQLSTHVVLTSVKDRSVLHTDRLLYSPEKNKVYTDDPVAIDSPDGHMVGQGLEATPDLKEIKIKKQKTTITK